MIVDVMQHQQVTLPLIATQTTHPLKLLDVNKILRVAYGSDTVYQNLALAALEVWKEWNKELSSNTNLPNGLTSEDVLYVNSGSLNIFTSPELPLSEQQSLDNLTASGMGHTQFVAGKLEDSESDRTGIWICLRSIQQDEQRKTV